MPRKKCLNVLIACEISQVEMQAFRNAGCNAFSCDLKLLQGRGDIRYHIPGDVSKLLSGYRYFYTQDAQLHHVPGWDLIVAHPPCTYLAKVGSPWMKKDVDFGVLFRDNYVRVNRDRYEKMQDARAFFFKCLEAKAPFVAVENPLPMALAELPKSSFFVDPSDFGDRWTKKTLFWTKNLPPLFPTIKNPEARSYVHSSRGEYRSKSFSSIAQAMATQWVAYIENQKKKSNQ